MALVVWTDDVDAAFDHVDGRGGGDGEACAVDAGAGFAGADLEAAAAGEDVGEDPSLLEDEVFLSLGGQDIAKGQPRLPTADDEDLDLLRAHRKPRSRRDAAASCGVAPRRIGADVQSTPLA